MYCTKCGKQISEGHKFCTGCGNPVVQPKQPKAEQPQMQPPNRQPAEARNIPVQTPNVQAPNVQPSNVQAPNAQTSSVQTPQMKAPDVQPPNMPPVHYQETREPKKKDKSKNVIIILLVVLVILVLVAIGMAAYYFMVLRNDSNDGTVETEEFAEDIDMTGEQEIDAQTDLDTGDEQEEPIAEEPVEEPEEEEEAKVTSDTNEVIKDTIIYSIPKSVYSYDFDESLGNAQVVIRKEADTMPEIVNDAEPRYVSGMDGYAVYLDGTYGIRLSDVEKVGTSYTVAFWMNADTFYDWAPFIHIGYNLLHSDLRCRLWLGQKTDGVSVAPIISSEQARTNNSFEIRPSGAVRSMDPGVWYHIAFVVDGTDRGSSVNSLHGTLYVDGQYAGEGNIALDVMNVDNFDVYLGINCWDELYPVAFDSVKIWDQVLDADQVEELFNAYQ